MVFNAPYLQNEHGDPQIFFGCSFWVGGSGGFLISSKSVRTNCMYISGVNVLNEDSL